MLVAVCATALSIASSVLAAYAIAFFVEHYVSAMTGVAKE